MSINRDNRKSFWENTREEAMDIGVLTVALKHEPLEQTIAFLHELGIDAVEIGAGGHPGEDHIARERLLADKAAQAAFRDLMGAHAMYVSALATHNNPLHPQEAIAAEADRELRETIELANVLGIPCVTCFSGLPGGGPNDKVPNWITAPWPPEHADALEYQWEVAIEYWQDLAGYAEQHNVNIAIEMHPNMLIYEPSGLLGLRDATNDRVGVNFDPSHLIWQGIDIPTAIRELGAVNAIHHVHAKDTMIYEPVARRKGVLDTTPYLDEVNRSWLFRSIGYGNGETFWKDVVSTLRMVGYDGVLSIEHEDSLTSSREGLEKGVDLLSRALFRTSPDEAHWT